MIARTFGMITLDHSCCCCARLWLQRPLPDELLAYAVDDVRYLPALVMLMERDLLQVRQHCAPALCASTRACAPAHDCALDVAAEQC